MTRWLQSSYKREAVDNPAITQSQYEDTANALQKDEQLSKNEYVMTDEDLERTTYNKDYQNKINRWYGRDDKVIELLNKLEDAIDYSWIVEQLESDQFLADIVMKYLESRAKELLNNPEIAQLIKDEQGIRTEWINIDSERLQSQILLAVAEKLPLTDYGRTNLEYVLQKLGDNEYAEDLKFIFLLLGVGLLGAAAIKKLIRG
mgnify:CR=1 FL=1